MFTVGFPAIPTMSARKLGRIRPSWSCREMILAFLIGQLQMRDDRSTTAYSVMNAMIFIVPPLFGQTIGSTSYFRPHRHPSSRVFDDPPRPGERRWAQRSRDVNLDIVACLQDGARALDGNPSAFLFISFLPWCNILLEEAP